MKDRSTVSALAQLLDDTWSTDMNSWDLVFEGLFRRRVQLHPWTVRLTANIDFLVPHGCTVATYLWEFTASSPRQAIRAALDWCTLLQQWQDVLDTHAALDPADSTLHTSL